MNNKFESFIYYCENKQEEFVLTLEVVIGTISPLKETPQYDILKFLCETDFKIAKNQGKTDEKAAQAALDNLSKRVIALSKT
jgi:hypothetical protein